MDWQMLNLKEVATSQLDVRFEQLYRHLVDMSGHDI